MRTTSVLSTNGDWINLVPQAQGGAARLEARMNAVVVQVLPDGGRLIHIECVDQEMLPLLRQEAHKIIGF